LTLAILAPFAVPAQTLISVAAPAPLLLTSSALPSLAASSASVSSVSTSLSASASASAFLPPVSSQFEAIFSVPCSAGVNANRGPAVDFRSPDGSRELCVQVPESYAHYARFLDSLASSPLTPAEKGFLALRNFDDPANLGTITNIAAFTVATNPHNAYGPGMRGFGRNIGYSLAQDATGEFFGTFLIPSLTRQDPHYHRDPNASIPRRILHAVSRTVVAQSDSGSLMPNFATLAVYPIGAELANLYVPGIHTNGLSTTERILTGYASDPIDNLITEFLPDVARRIHVRVIFAQRILNQVSSDDFDAH